MSSSQQWEQQGLPPERRPGAAGRTPQVPQVAPKGRPPEPALRGLQPPQEPPQGLWVRQLPEQQPRGQQGLPVGWVSVAHTPSGTPKLVGQGPLFFWAQMLMGDTADNIAGVLRYNGKLCGAVGAYDVLKDVQDINVAANTVIDAYRVIDQNVLAEGWLLWLTRWHGDNVLQYMQSLALTSENDEFVRACSMRDWVAPKEASIVRDTND